jgi:hypothetical protein
VNHAPIITPERFAAFQFTNALRPNRAVAVYTQQVHHTKFIDFKGLAAGVSRDVYLLMIVISCLLVALFTFIEYVRPSNKFNFLDITTAMLPCFNGQAPALEHSSSLARCVAIISASIFVFLATTYYQTLLLSIYAGHRLKLLFKFSTFKLKALKGNSRQKHFQAAIENDDLLMALSISR